MESDKQQPIENSSRVPDKRSPEFFNIMPMQSRLSILLLACGIALIGSVFAVRFFNAPQLGVVHDDAEYIVLAESFTKGQPLREINFPDSPLQTIYPPGYPLFVLSLPVLLFGPNLIVFRLINFSLLIGIAIIGYRLLRLNYGGPIAIASILLFIINPKVVGQATVAMSDMTFAFLVALWLLLFKLESSNDRITPRYLAAIVILAATVLVRYWGIAFVGAAGIALLLERKYRKLLALIIGLIVLWLPLLLFLAAQQADASADSYLALQAVSANIQHYAKNLQLSLSTYSEAIPLVLIPLVGPQVISIVTNIGLGWLADVFNLLVVLMVTIGFVLSIKKWRFIALSIGCYLLLLFLLTNHRGVAIVFDEPRYLIPITLFLYAYFLAGLKAIPDRLTRWENNGRLVYIAAALLVVFMFWRNLQQASVVFPVADLSTGSAWAQEFSAQDAVFMTPDPEARYLHLQRRTANYPEIGSTSELVKELEKLTVTHMIQAPPLILGGNPNVDQLMDQNINAVVGQLTRAYPECLESVFEDAEQKTTILEVDRACMSR